MRSNIVVVTAPRLDQDNGLGPAAKPFDAELVAQLAVEALVEAVLPRLARIDERRADVLLDEPLQNRLGDEFRPVVGAQEGRRAVHEPGEHLDGTLRADAAGRRHVEFTQRLQRCGRHGSHRAVSSSVAITAGRARSQQISGRATRAKRSLHCGRGRGLDRAGQIRPRASSEFARTVSELPWSTNARASASWATGTKAWKPSQHRAAIASACSKGTIASFGSPSSSRERPDHQLARREVTRASAQPVVGGLRVIRAAWPSPSARWTCAIVLSVSAASNGPSSASAVRSSVSSVPLVGSPAVPAIAR